jgi:CheY-like chemotaxis protein
MGRFHAMTSPSDQNEHCCSAGNHRLNLLLSVPQWRQGTAVDHLPQLLEPMGINSLRAASGEEAADVIRSVRVHIAVVDLSVPLMRISSCSDRPMPAVLSPSASEGGPRILQLLRRLDQPPPTVVVRPPQPVARESGRSLTEALREGAFAVLDQPVNLEAMLEVMRRILRRHYADVWPV